MTRDRSSKNARQFLGREYAVLALRQIAERQSAGLEAMQRHHVIADGAEHAPQLVITAFGENHHAAVRAFRAPDGGLQRLIVVPQHKRAGGEQRRLVAAQRITQGDAVMLGGMGFGVNDAVKQRAVIGEQQLTGAVFVQPPDRGERRFARAKTRRQQIVDYRAGRAGRVVRAGATRWFVQHEGERGGRIDRRAVKMQRTGAHLVQRDQVRGVVQRGAVKRDSAGSAGGGNFLAGGVSQIGKQAVKPLGGRGRNVSAFALLSAAFRRGRYPARDAVYLNNAAARPRFAESSYNAPFATAPQARTG